MNSAPVYSSRCLQWNCTTKTVSTIGIALSTIVLLGGVLALLASTGYNLGALNCLSHLGVAGSSFTMALGGTSFLLSVYWVVKMRRKNPPPKPEIQKFTPNLVKQWRFTEKLHDFETDPTYQFKLWATSTGLYQKVGQEPKSALIPKSIDRFHLFYALHLDGANSSVFNFREGIEVQLPHATAFTFEREVYVSFSDGKICAYHPRTFEQTREFDSKLGSIVDLFFCLDRIFVISPDRLSVVDTGLTAVTTISELPSLTSLTGDEQYVYAGSEAGTDVFDRTTYEPVFSHRALQPVTFIFADGGRFCTGHVNGRVLLWNRHDFSIEKEVITGCEHPVVKLGIQGNHLLVVSGKSASIFDLNTPAESGAE